MDRLAQARLRLAPRWGLLVVALGLAACESDVERDCSSVPADECVQQVCALTNDFGCRNRCEDEDDCSDGIACREVSLAPPELTDDNPGTALVCLPR